VYLVSKHTVDKIKINYSSLVIKVHDRDKLGNETEMEHKNKSIIRMKKMTSLQ